uniref:Immunoglobulin V-set domain-containing protein n=1 Tax=Sinocyclocheilus rhinocerous TaxID=307959 RepID=A0A673HED3_9TELE
KMTCVVRYNFLLINIFLRSTSWAAAMVQVTPLIRAVGNEVIIQCATDKSPQDGVYMYKKEGASENKQEVFYYYKEKTFPPKSRAYNSKVRVDGAFPNLNATFLNVNTTDIGLYWCEFNLEDKLTVGTFTWLWIEKKQEEAKEKEDKKECPEDIPPHVKMFLIVCAAMSLLFIIGFIFVFLKVKGCWGNKKYRPSNLPSDSVYEEMKRNNLDAQPSVRTFINPDYQSTKLLC